MRFLPFVLWSQTRFLLPEKKARSVIGIGDGSNYIGSDILSFLPHTRKYVPVNDGEEVVLRRDRVTVYDADHKESIREPELANWSWEAGNKGDYDYFMLKEIKEQPTAIRQALAQDSKLITQMAIEIMGAHEVIFIACGTSRHAALIGRYAFSKIGRIFSEVVMGSEFRYFSESVDKNTLVVAISQSGETADVMDGVRAAKANGAKVFSLTNVVASSLARSSDQVLYLNCGPEIGVAATKSFTSQICLLYQLAFAMDHRLDEVQDNLRNISRAVASDLNYYYDYIPALANKSKSKKDFYYLARGVNFAVASEGALKLKEIAYVHAEGMPAGELKHGTLALIEEGTPVIAVCPSDYTFDDTISNVMEAKARGAYVLGVSDAEPEIFDDCIRISKVEEIMYPLVTTIPLQIFAYYSALARGLDPDKPRNLAKSVTVK